MPLGKSPHGPRKAGPSGIGPALNQAGIKRRVIVIGASAGGVVALQRLFAGLPARLPAVVGVVLHRGPMPVSRIGARAGT